MLLLDISTNADRPASLPPSRKAASTSASGAFSTRGAGTESLGFALTGGLSVFALVAGAGAVFL
jgi:hypothetical protein